MIEIDGSHGEGGGQLVRNAAALSAVTGTPVRIRDVRAKRKNPGLAAQHVAALHTLADLANAEVSGLELGSQEIVVKPGTVRGGRFRAEVGTAGSVALVLQACLPVALRAPDPVEILVTGGTDVRWAPPADYVRHVFLPLLARMGGTVEFEVERRGYYPRGGGEVRAKVQPVDAFRPLLVEPPGDLRGVQGIAHVGNLPEHVAQRMKKAALRQLVAVAKAKITSTALSADGAVGPGGSIVLWTEHVNTVLGASALAERGKPAEQLGESAAKDLASDLKAGVSLDIHASDQVLIYAALADGPSEFSAHEVSSHAATTMWLLEKFLPVRFETVGAEGRVSVRVVPGDD